VFLVFFAITCITGISGSTCLNKNIQLSAENVWASFGKTTTHNNMDKKGYGYEIVMRFLKVLFNEAICSFNIQDHKDKI